MESPIRICQFTPCLWSGGTEERIARIIKTLEPGEFEVNWLGFGPAREALADKAGAHIKMHPIQRYPNRGIELACIQRVARKLYALKPHILHIHNWSTSLYGIAAAQLAQVPVIFYGSGGREVSAGADGRRQKLMRALGQHIDGFTSVCQFLGDELAEDFAVPQERIHVIKTGVDLEKIDQGRSRSQARQALGIPDSALVIGAISVFRPVKRIPDLIEAVGKIAQTNANVHLLLIGNPVRMTVEELQALGEKHGLANRIHLPGRLENPSDVLKAFDIFVNCSDFEGSSNAIIESMAAGLAVVGTTVGGTPELIEDGRTGLLVPPRNVPMLHEALQRLCDSESLRAELGGAAQEHARRDHDCEQMFQTYRNLYISAHSQISQSLLKSQLKRLNRSMKSIFQLLPEI